jgi:hypothetical protein
LEELAYEENMDNPLLVSKDIDQAIENSMNKSTLTMEDNNKA